MHRNYIYECGYPRDIRDIHKVCRNHMTTLFNSRSSFQDVITSLDNTDSFAFMAIFP
jgi:hypothetical protein